MLDGKETVVTLLQPEYSHAFVPVETGMGLGWAGVYRWCRQASEQQGASFQQNSVFQFHDILVVHLDADVAGLRYSSAHLEDPSQDLPCEKPCPPPIDTTNALRKVVLRWMGERVCPPRTVFCMPSKCLETWILAGLYPDDRDVRSGGLECKAEIVSALSGKPASGRLVRRKGRGYDKDVHRYRRRSKDFRDSWRQVTAICSEAARFRNDLHNEAAALSELA